MKNSVQLKISLAGIKPLIWRRVVINRDLPLAALSSVIQTVMPWSGNHLHQFIVKGSRFVCPYPECEDSEDIGSIEKYESTRVGDLLSEVDDFIKYEYDFGDSWMHNISVEKVLPAIEDRGARYVRGKNMAPPEDCGGTAGYERLKLIMSDYNHPEYGQMANWLGMDAYDEFDPTYIGCDDEDIDEELYGI